MMMNFLLKPRSVFLLVFFIFIILAIFFYFLIPHNFTWMGYQNVNGDTAQHLSGWYAFIHEPWHFPLLKIYSINYPIGTTISLTDSIPLFAISFKLFKSFIPSGFNFFAFFLIFIYLFQAFAALTLAYSVKKNNLLIVSALVIFSITAPIVSNRTGGEDSLACQGFIIFGISGYFFSYFNKWGLNTCHLFFGILIALSLLVHPYLTAMTYPFYLISLLKIKVCRNLSWQVVWKPIMIMHVCILLEACLFGLGQGTDKHNGGFGYYTMNLISPIYGGRLTNDQSIIAYPGQGEGFAYLGLGLIVLLILTGLINCKKFKLIYKQHCGLIIIAILFFFYTIYGNLYFGQYEILRTKTLHIFIINNIINNFRTAGRFFWPVWYILMVSAILSLAKFKPKLSAIILVICTVLQIFDVSGYIKNTRLALQNDFTLTVPSPQFNQIIDLIQTSNLVVFYPKMACPNMKDADYFLLINTQLLTAKAGTPINTGYIAHVNTPSKNCVDDANNFPQFQHKLLIANVSNPSPTILTLVKTKPQSCHIIDQVYYCEYP